MTFRAVVLLMALMGAGQDFGSMKPELVADGFPGGEGPVWSRDGFLLFSDYSRDRIYKYVPGKAPEVFREGSNGTNGNAMDAQGRLYSCEYKSRRVTRTASDGKVEVLFDRFEGKRFNAPNDIVVRRDGHYYFTDPLFTPHGAGQSSQHRVRRRRSEDALPGWEFDLQSADGDGWVDVVGPAEAGRYIRMRSTIAMVLNVAMPNSIALSSCFTSTSVAASAPYAASEGFFHLPRSLTRMSCCARLRL